MSIDVNALIGEVAKRHHLVLQRDDPLLISVTLNELVMTELIEKVLSALDDAQAKAVVGAENQVEIAKGIAARVVNDGAAYVIGQAKAQITAALQHERAQLAGLVEQAVGAARTAWWALAATWIAATVAVALAALMWTGNL